MQKETKIKIVKAVSFSALTAAVLSVLAIFAFTPIEKTQTAYGSFYAEKGDSLDLVFVGNSTSREDFIPAEAWNRYGLTSHCIGSNPSHLEVIKIAIDEIARTQKPKMVFVDVNGLTFQNKESATSYVTNYISSMPDGEAKEKWLEEYPYAATSDGFELFKNHNNWRDQYWWETKLFKSQSYKKGYDPHTGVMKIDPIAADPDRIDAEWLDIDPGLATDPDKVAHTPRDYLVEILEICKKHPNIDWVIGEMPRFLSNGSEREKMTMDRYYELRACKSVVESYGLTWWDLCDSIEEMNLNPHTDQWDGDHFNHGGAKRFTKWFGQYVADKYGITKKTHTDAEVVEDFDKAYEEYRERVDEPLMKKMKLSKDYDE